eukprot:gnl/MRDRNA2_/MRDRNA2_73109_c0_seq1.p1 gnl/MRDRNA2_/MRDRNA2_73109_c0~~gnl/MRDRNA2_/MRDRNA2_73109_c0_seq1.p1  ORF type:complete len:384 (+),score=42.04 gnl/MRDRNA2_/MRDRNA2_73109_c0_seq1:122-1273(+)
MCGLSFGVAAGPRTTQGLPVHAAGSVTANDTFVLGSGTKPYTAAGVMRLVEAGGAHLNDKVAQHIDSVMKVMWNTTLEELFGPMAGSILVAHLIRMESGLADIENIPGREQAVLFNNSVNDPIDDLRAVAALPQQFGCKPPQQCVWHFIPGTQTEYSSTNYLLAGIMLLAHSTSQRTWQAFDQAASLGQEFRGMYTHTFFPTTGPLNKVGLSCAGNGIAFGSTEVYQQDASIMGLAWGSTTASAWDVAHFYFKLVGPMHDVVSEESLSYMKHWRLLSYGWDNGTKRYGAGLETNNPSPSIAHWRAPPLDHISTGIGHHGQTYGFEMLGGYYPALNASIVVMTNQDAYRGFGFGVACRVVQKVAHYTGWDGSLNCTEPSTHVFV